jgi:hypothetical protein
MSSVYHLTGCLQGIEFTSALGVIWQYVMVGPSVPAAISTALQRERVTSHDQE